MIELKNVNKYYTQDNNVTTGLRNVSVTLTENEFVAITGESGSGKTTFLNVISGMDTYEEGEMIINGEETSYFSSEDFENYRKKNVGFIFQNYNLIDSYTVLQNVEIPLILKGLKKEERQKRAKEIIEKVGLTSRLHHRGTKLSGGEKQRVVIARALASDSQILACDEPTGNLDSETGKQIIELLKEISKDKLVLIVTHNYDEVKDYCTRKLRFYDGELVEDREVNVKNKKKIKEDTSRDLKIPVINDREKVYDKSFWFAFKNLINTPRRTLLTFFVFVSAIFVFVNMSSNMTIETSFSPYINGFNHLTEDRVVIKDKDNKPLSSRYLEKLKNHANISYIETNDQISDFSFGMENPEFGVYMMGFRHIDAFDKSKLVVGKMPQTETEVLISSHTFSKSELEKNVGKTIQINYYTNSPPRKFTIAGFFDYKNHNYERVIFGTDVLRASISAFQETNANNFALYSDNERFTCSIIFDDKLTKPVYTSSRKLDNPELFYEDLYQKKKVDFDYQINEKLTHSVLRISLESLKSIQSDVYQISVYLKSTYSLKDTLKSLEDDNISLLNISKFSASSEDVFSVIQNIFTVVASFIGFLLIAFVTQLIVYFILSHKKRDYAIFRSLGANNKILKNIIFFENLMLALIGFIFVFILCIVLSNFVEYPAFDAFKHFDMQIIFITLITSVFLSFIISAGFNRRMFKNSININLRRD